MIRHMQ